jgi:integrase
VTLINELPNLLSNVLASETTMYVGLRVPLGGAGQTEFRCWQPDPVTAILLARSSPQAHFNLESAGQGSISFKTLAKAIREIRRSELERDQNSDLCGLETLIKAVQTIAYVQLPAMVAAYGSRKFHSDSLPFEAIMRIAKVNWIIRPGSDATPSSASRATGRSEVRNYTIERPWSAEFNAAIRDDMKWSLVTENLRGLAEGEELPPLGRRLADFAARAFSVRTLYDKRRSARTMTTRLLLLAGSLSHVHGTADIIGLPTESLEHLYRKAIQDLRNRGTNCRETNSLLRALHELHSYLCALHGKAPLSDDKLLAPLPVLDHTDANILTIEEYKQLLSIIELRWPPDEDFERRRIARLMVILGFRAGLRREECRLLRVNDLILRGRKHLWVRPSKGHTLKSDHSLRRVEIWKLLGEGELEELERWMTGRSLSGSDFLFKTSALDVVPPSIFETINGFMREVIGGSNVSARATPWLTGLG